MTLVRRETHPDWCAGGHRCGLGEHRADELVIDVGHDRLILTRIRGRDGRQFAEIRASVQLPDHDGYARLHLIRLINRLARAIGARREART